MCAAETGNEEIVEILLENKADLHATDVVISREVLALNSYYVHSSKTDSLLCNCFFAACFNSIFPSTIVCRVERLHL